MSNQVVGNVYQQIIDRVITASNNDFEESGVDTSTPEEMKQGWQEKLSGLRIAAFPWDPQPESPRQPPTVPSNVKHEPEVSPAASVPQQEHLNFPNIPIKSERGYDQPMSSYPPAHAQSYQGGYSGDLAAQRAQNLIAQRLSQAPPQNLQMPQQHQGQPQYRQQPMMPQQGQQRPPQPMQQRPQQGHVYTSQTDGPGDALEDWKALVATRRAEDAADPEGRIAADQLMRTRIDAMMADQDTGLGMPLSQMPKGKKRKAITRVRQERQAEASSSSSAVPGAVPARFDGEDVKEEEENPDDAINSELDDSEDDLNGADNSDDDMIDYMLCTYDKVQRVKNKWKCTLKDGILTTNKKEYLFHKANGEFEW